MIECQLFDYFFPNSDKGTHLYEALSYVWGIPHNNHSITLDSCPFGVTANLHATLSRLRNRYIERVVWIDAICINQEDLKERRYQIQRIARIFGKAKCVIVWLRETAARSDRAFEAIGFAADNNLATPSITTELRNNVLRLIERPWFRRIWVRALRLGRMLEPLTALIQVLELQVHWILDPVIDTCLGRSEDGGRRPGTSLRYS
jgi:hypothetical protein